MAFQFGTAAGVGYHQFVDHAPDQVGDIGQFTGGLRRNAAIGPAFLHPRQFSAIAAVPDRQHRAEATACGHDQPRRRTRRTSGRGVAERKAPDLLAAGRGQRTQAAVVVGDIDAAAVGRQRRTGGTAARQGFVGPERREGRLRAAAVLHRAQARGRGAGGPEREDEAPGGIDGRRVRTGTGGPAGGAGQHRLAGRVGRTGHQFERWQQRLPVFALQHVDAPDMRDEDQVAVRGELCRQGHADDRCLPQRLAVGGEGMHGAAVGDEQATFAIQQRRGDRREAVNRRRAPDGIAGRTVQREQMAAGRRVQRQVQPAALVAGRPEVDAASELALPGGNQPARSAHRRIVGIPGIGMHRRPAGAVGIDRILRRARGRRRAAAGRCQQDAGQQARATHRSARRCLHGETSAVSSCRVAARTMRVLPSRTSTSTTASIGNLPT